MANPGRPSPATRSLTVLGVGTVVTIVAGLLVGLVLGDVPHWLGRIGTVGMTLTAVVGVLAAVVPWPPQARDGRPGRPAGRGGRSPDR